MGRKGKSKAKKVKRLKSIAKKNKKKTKLKDVTAAVSKADAQGLDVGSLAESALSGIPFVGPLIGDIAGQAISGAGGQGVSGRGGVRGVTLVDSRLGNIGVISRRKALSMLINQKKRPRTLTRKVQFITAPQGSQVVKV